MKSYADGYVLIVQKYTPSNGALAEQFDKSDGSPVSAADLTWSYASFLTMAAARDNVLPASWGAGSAHQVPSMCSASSATGTYTAAMNTNWPKFSCTIATSVQVTFNVLASTFVGQDIFVVGSVAELGGWDTSKGVPLSANSYRDDIPLWYGSVELSEGTQLQYKYIRKEADGKIVWESDPNRYYTVPTSCRKSALIGDKWR